MERNARNRIPELVRSVRKLGLEDAEGTEPYRHALKEELENMYNNCVEYGFQMWNDPIKSGTSYSAD